MQSEELGALRRRALFLCPGCGLLEHRKMVLHFGPREVDYRHEARYYGVYVLQKNINERQLQKTSVFDGSFSCDMNRFSFAEN
jgi:hypothetical protein